MSKIEEIKQAAEQLDLNEFVKLAIWVDQRRQRLEISPPVTDKGSAAIRDHSAFLNSYAPQDEGLYDDAATRVKSGWRTFLSRAVSPRSCVPFWCSGRMPPMCWLAAVTSAQPRSTTDVALQNSAAAGLRVASTVRLSRLDCLEQYLLRRRLGLLAPNDAEQMKRVWSNEIRLRF